MTHNSYKTMIDILQILLLALSWAIGFIVGVGYAARRESEKSKNN